jgi:hypothetical protein
VLPPGHVVRPPESRRGRSPSCPGSDACPRRTGPGRLRGGAGQVDEPLIDCHVHVFDPDRFPYAADAYYIPTGPETGTVEQWRQTHDVHGVRHALPVGPNSGYGEDNRCLLDAVARGAGRFRGVAVVSNRATPAELSGLRDDGMLGGSSPRCSHARGPGRTGARPRRTAPDPLGHAPVGHSCFRAEGSSAPRHARLLTDLVRRPRAGGSPWEAATARAPGAWGPWPRAGPPGPPSHRAGSPPPSVRSSG